MTTLNLIETPNSHRSLREYQINAPKGVRITVTYCPSDPPAERWMASANDIRFATTSSREKMLELIERTLRAASEGVSKREQDVLAAIAETVDVPHPTDARVVRSYVSAEVVLTTLEHWGHKRAAAEFALHTACYRGFALHGARGVALTPTGHAAYCEMRQA